MYFKPSCWQWQNICSCSMRKLAIWKSNTTPVLYCTPALSLSNERGESEHDWPPSVGEEENFPSINRFSQLHGHRSQTRSEKPHFELRKANIHNSVHCPLRSHVAGAPPEWLFGFNVYCCQGCCWLARSTDALETVSAGCISGSQWVNNQKTPVRRVRRHPTTAHLRGWHTTEIPGPRGIFQAHTLWVWTGKHMPQKFS